MRVSTADLSDQHSAIHIATPGFRDFGGILAFSGYISTVRCPDDNSKVREALSEDGQGRVLVIDGNASGNCALLGDILAGKAQDNNWSGIIVNGLIRDSAVIATLSVGVKALGTYPLKSVKRDLGERDVTVQFAGVDFVPGHWLAADTDGILVSEIALL